MPAQGRAKARREGTIRRALWVHPYYIIGTGGGQGVLECYD